MKQRILKILLLIETLIIVSAMLWGCLTFVNSKKTELLRETSPDGNYLLIIQELGTPDWPFGADHLKISLYEQNAEPRYRVSFQADVFNDGCTANYEIEWLEDSVQIALIGSEQPTAYYVLPFKTLQQQLINTEEDCISDDKLDESRVIAEQSFNVDLNDWGKVRFVSYRPTYDTLWEDVSFVLAKDNQIVYYFPACFENNSTENDSIGMFDSVEAVGFQDIDGDNAKDVIVIINYVTGAGPQGMLPRKSVRIFKACDNGFIILEDMMSEIMENMDESELSVPIICEYIESN